MNTVKRCIKRDGRTVKFDKTRIQTAITKAFEESNEGNNYISKKVTEHIIERIERSFNKQVPTVEQIQDLVEESLMLLRFRNTAKRYILYREMRNQERETFA